jgi:hypothetical protein
VVVDDAVAGQQVYVGHRRAEQIKGHRYRHGRQSNSPDTRHLKHRFSSVYA